MKSNTRLSAVLLPFHYSEDGHLHLSLIRRAPGGAHGGQLAFPGGKYEPEDASLLDTALRESWEEVGLDRDSVTIVRSLTPLFTYTGFVIHPFVGLLHKQPTQWLIAQDEVAEVISVSMEQLISTPSQHAVLHPESKSTRHFPCFEVSGHPLWGASYRMLEPIVEDYRCGKLTF